MNQQATFTPKIEPKGNIPYKAEVQPVQPVEPVQAKAQKVSKVAKVADATVQTLNRMNPTKITKFNQMTGQQPGEWLRERNIVDTPEKTVEKLIERHQKSKAEADKGLDAIE